MDEKAAVLRAIAGQNRGLLATAADRARILAAIADLEALNPTPAPVTASPLLAGNWRLLYTTSRELLGLNRLPLAQLGPIYQCIRPEAARVYNLAEIVSVPLLAGLVCVAARYEATAAQRLTVNFERAIFGLQRLLRYQSAEAMIDQIEAGQNFPPLDFRLANRDRSGWIDITYLDDTLRINRGNEGSVFVLAKDA